MKMQFLKPVALAALMCTAMVSCINDDDYNAPANACVEPGLTANKTVAEIVAASTSAIQNYTAQDVIEAYVVSSDERGNFFKIVYLQTLPADGAPVGFSISIDKNTLFGEGFYPGKKVYINLKGLDFARTNNALSLGLRYTTTSGALAIGRIPEQQFMNFAIPSCSEVSEDQLVRQMTIAEAKNNANLNTLIELTGVQFADDEVGGTYYDIDDEETAGGATNRTLVDANGNEIPFRTSSFGNFSGDIIPGKSGKVRGVLTYYSNTSEWQFMARSREDIQLTNDRLVDVVNPSEPSPSAKGGTAIVYAGSLNETFESYAVDNQVFPAYVNDNSVGTRYWDVALFGGTKYIEMTSFNGQNNPGVAAASEIFIPVDFGPAATLTFDKKIRFMAGQALKVYYATNLNYTPGNTYDVSTFTDITADFTNLNTAYPATGASDNNFSNAGVYNIPTGLTGQGFFVFQYVGSATVTTTVQLDNIVITAQP